MTFVEVHEAQLFRLLSGLFGSDRVVPHMSVMAVCNGEFPSTLDDKNGSLRTWARANKCLFTIVDHEDMPKLVVEFFSGFAESVDAEEAEHQARMPGILTAAGVRYVTISKQELGDILSPQGTLDLCTFLESKVLSSTL